MSHSNEFWNFGNADRSEDTPKGYFTPLFPHNLGRPLHHPEQDYNAHLISQIVKGFRVIGSGTDGVMTTDDLEMGIKLHEIDPSDADYLHYIACGCKDEEWIWVPAEMGANAVSPLNVIGSAMDQNDCSQTAGTITAYGTGGAPTYEFSLQTSPTVQPGNISTWQTTGYWNTFNGNNLVIGQPYYVYIRDASGVIDISSQIIIDLIEAPVVTLTVTQNATTPGAEDGKLEASITGGIGNYNYNLYKGAVGDTSTPWGQIIGTAATTVEFPTFNSAFPIGAGSYHVRVLDNSTGCEVGINTAIIVSQPDPLEVVTNAINGICQGDSHEFVFNGATGGTPNYEYSITNPATTGYTWSAVQTYDSITPGNTSIWPAVKDATGYIIDLGQIEFYESAAFSFTAIPQDTECDGTGGSIQFSNLLGGPPPIVWPLPRRWQFSTDNGATWSMIWVETNPGDIYTTPPLGAGTYMCMARIVHPTDDLITGNCGFAQTIIISEAPMVTFTIDSLVGDSDCSTNGTGEINITDIKIGGNSPSQPDLTYDVLIMQGNTTIATSSGEDNGTWSYNNLDAGTYSITITHVNGCSKTEIFEINLIASSLVLNVTAVDICPNSITNVNYTFDFGSGIVNIYDTVEYANDPVNATPLVTSSDANGSGTFSSSYGIGTHSFTAVDVTACEIVTTITISAIQDPTITLNPTNPTCGNDGSIEAIVSNATITGGADPILELEDSLGNITTSIPVNTFGNTVYFPNIIGGTYIVRIINDECLSGVSETVLLQPGVAPIVTVVATDVSCNGLNDGSAIINISGGVPDYEITVTAPNGSTQTYSQIPVSFSIPAALVPGTYTIDGVDDNGCIFNGSFDITEPDAFIVDAVQVIYGACWIPTSSGVQIAFSGGTLDYSAAIFDSNNTQIGPAQTGIGATSFTFLDDNTYPLPTGLYYIIGTDANGCTIQSDQFEIPPCSFAATFDSTTNSEINCHQGTGDIITVVSGGSGNYEFSLDGTTWDGPYSPANAGDPYTYTFTDSTFIGGTTHDIYVRDSDDLTSPADTVSYTLIDPDAITVTTNSPTPESVSGAADGEVSFSDIIGGTQPYATLALFDSTQTQIDIVNLPVPSTTYTFDNLEAGIYYIIITDDNGCESSKIYSTVADGSAPLTFSSSLGQITCFGGTTNVDVTVFGGSGTFRFSNDGGNSWTAYLNQTTYTFTGMAAGSHTIVVEDQQSYPGNPMSDAITLNQPPLVQTQSSSTNETIVGEEDGTITLQVSGGTADYTVSLYGNGYTSNIVGTPGQTLFQFDNLVAQGYTYLTEDSNGCSAGSNITIASGTPQINATVNAGTILCPNGTTDVTMTTSDGSGDYQYGINPTSSASNPPSNWTATTQNTTYTWNVGAGSLYYWVKDAVTGTERWVNEAITDPDAISVSYNGAETYPGAGDASIQIFIDGGTPVYTAKCIETNELLTNLQDEAPGVPSGTFTTITSAGQYNIEITDANGCQITSVLTVTSIFTNISITNVIDDTLCYGETNGKIEIYPSGGSGNYEFSRNGGSGYSSANYGTYGYGKFLGVAPGSYDVWIRDTSTGEELEWSSNPVVISEAQEIQVISETMTDGTCSDYPSYTMTFSGSNITQVLSNQQVRLKFTSPVMATVIATVTATGTPNVYQADYTSAQWQQLDNAMPSQYDFTSGTFNLEIESDDCEITHGPISYTTADDIVLTVTPVSEPECPNSLWTYEVSATGGTNTTYKLMTAPNSLITTWDGSSLQFTLPQIIGGTTAILAQDADFANNGCQSNTVIVDTREVSELIVSGNVNNPLCANPGGGSTYSFTIAGGLPSGNTYKYKVSSDGGTTWSGQNDYTGPVSGIPIADGSLWIRAYRIVNGNSTEGNCDVEVDLGTVTNPLSLSGSISGQWTASPSACTGPDASTGIIAILVTGGTGTYLFSKDGGTSYVSLTMDPMTFTYNFTGLTAGTYGIYVKDSNECPAFNATQTLSSPATPQVSNHSFAGCWRDSDTAMVELSIFLNDVSGQQNGDYTFYNAQADVTSNTDGKFVYSNSDMTTHAQTAVTITNNTTGCATTMNTFNFTPVSSITSTASITDINGFPNAGDINDFTVANVSGGYGPPYTVSLEDANGNVSTVTVPNQNGTAYIHNVPAGDYTYSITDTLGGTTGCGRTYTTIMTATVQQFNERTIYYFHGGQTAFPYASSYLTNSSCIYYTPAIQGGSATLSDAMTEVINNGGTDPYYGGAGAYTVDSFDMPAGHTITSDGTGSYTQWTFAANGNSEYYYLAIPNNSDFPENLITAPPYNLMDSGVPTNAAERKAFTYGGESYWLYRMGGGDNTITRSFGFNN